MMGVARVARRRNKGTTATTITIGVEETATTEFLPLHLLLLRISRECLVNTL
jgi:hypothetical protein